MKSNRKQYSGGAQEFKTRADASEFAKEKGFEHYRIERRYAPHSANRSDDGYVCVIRVQEKPFGPINAQRSYYSPEWDLTTIPDEVWRTEYARRIKPPAPRARVESPCVQCAAPLSARERRKPCPKCGARQPRT